MVAPIFPKSTFGWTDRIDQISNVLANDPNSMAAEIISMENTLGSMPQVENSPFIGLPVTYSSVSARISDTMLGNQHPYSSLVATNLSVYNNQGSGTKYGQYNVYNSLYDPFSMYNGSDITTPCAGLYAIESEQTWAWYSSGWMGHSLIISNGFVCGAAPWQWNFPTSGPGSYTNDRYANTNFTWMGILGKNTRVRVLSENGTSLNPYPIVNSTLKVYLLRQMPQGQQG